MRCVMSLIEEHSQQWRKACWLSRHVLLDVSAEFDNGERIERLDWLVQRFFEQRNHTRIIPCVSNQHNFIDVATARLTSRGDHRSAYFSEQRFCLSVLVRLLRQSHRAEKRHGALNDDGKIGIVFQDINQQNGLAGCIVLGAVPKRCCSERAKDEVSRTTTDIATDCAHSVDCLG